MTDELSAAMHRATEAVRAGHPLEATAIIGAALGLPLQPAEGAASRAVRPASVPRVAPTDAGRRPTKPLGVVLDALKALRTPDRSVRPASSVPPTPPQAQFLARTHASAAGSRDYRLYVPAPGRKIRGLLVMLHGCKQDPDDFAVGTGMNKVAERDGLVVAYPGQTKRANIGSCWNWFDPAHQRRGDGEPTIIASLTEALQREFDIAPEHTFVAGLSAGAAMAAVLAATYPELYAAAGIHSGLPYRAASDAVSAFAAMREGRLAPAADARVRLIVFHGSADATVSPQNARHLWTAMTAAHPDAAPEVRHVEAGGRRCEIYRLEQGGTSVAEMWMVEGMGHAWAGGNGAGSYTDPAGPDASAEFARFFLAGPR